MINSLRARFPSLLRSSRQQDMYELFAARWWILKRIEICTEMCGIFTFSLFRFSHNSMRRGMEDSFQAYWVSSCREALKCLYCCWGKKENVAFNTQSIIFQLLCGFQSYKVEWYVVFFQFTFFLFFSFAFIIRLRFYASCFSHLLLLLLAAHSFHSF